MEVNKNFPGTKFFLERERERDRKFTHRYNGLALGCCGSVKDYRTFRLCTEMLMMIELCSKLSVGTCESKRSRITRDFLEPSQLVGNTFLENKKTFGYELFPFFF